MPCFASAGCRSIQYYCCFVPAAEMYLPGFVCRYIRLALPDSILLPHSRQSYLFFTEPWTAAAAAAAAAVPGRSLIAAVLRCTINIRYWYINSLYRCLVGPSAQGSGSRSGGCLQIGTGMIRSFFRWLRLVFLPASLGPCTQTSSSEAQQASSPRHTDRLHMGQIICQVGQIPS